MIGNLRKKRLMLAVIVELPLVYGIFVFSKSSPELLRSAITELFILTVWCLATLDSAQHKWQLTTISKFAGFSAVVDVVSYFFIDLFHFGLSLGFVLAGLGFVCFIYVWLLLAY
jgi:hypothetical protein